MYRRGIAEILESIAGRYPDTRAATALAALESTYGGDVEKARRYCVAGLQRPTRPRGYEMALIYAGKLIPDIYDAVNALQTAMDLLVSPVIPVLDEMGKDKFPFATRQRWIYKYQNLQFLADVIRQRGGRQSDFTYAREMMRIREQVLLVRREVRKKLEELGMVSGQDDCKFFYPGTIDEMLFELLDPEVVFEQEEFMRSKGFEVANSEESEALEGGDPLHRVQGVERIVEGVGDCGIKNKWVLLLKGLMKDAPVTLPVTTSAGPSHATPA